MNLPSSHSPEQETMDKSTYSGSDSSFWDIVRFSVIALLLIIPIRMYVAQPFIVSGASMEQTFQNGEYLIVDQLTYHFTTPQRGDVVIFRYPRDPSKFFIKRVIAIPGDTITISNNIVTITTNDNQEGFVINEPYIASQNWGGDMRISLEEKEYFVMGDNRNFSSDSRAWGVLHERHIIGRAFLRLFPPQSFGYLPGSVSDTTEPITTSP
jgi:signal peptidase I